jgi:3-methyladenine DNA glycosylase/8-oxoguanine DNA glycosylase
LRADPTAYEIRAVELTIRIAGPAGEPVDLWRTLMSHGVADLPPMRVDEEERTLTATLPVAGAKPRTVILRQGKRTALVDVLGPKLGARAEARLRETLRRVLNLDEDLSSFYEAAAKDPDLAWATAGAGRMLRSPSVFEEVVKTI